MQQANSGWQGALVGKVGRCLHQFGNPARWAGIDHPQFLYHATLMAQRENTTAAGRLAITGKGME